MGSSRSLDVAVEAIDLELVRRQEEGDEPLLYLNFYKLDGDGLDAAALAEGDPVCHDPGAIALGTDVRGTVAIPPAQGRWTTKLAPIRDATGGDTRGRTEIGVQAFAIEVDTAQYDEFRERRYAVWQQGQRFAITSALRHNELPNEAWLRRNADRLLSTHLGPWEGWPWGNPDDPLSGDVAAVTFADLEAQGRIERLLEFSGSGALYRLRVVFTAGK